MQQFHSLKVIGVDEQTKLAKQISFQVPSELTETFNYKPGQYLTLRFTLNGEEHRRAYSLCSSPKQDVLQVGVKRVKGGVVSNHINDTIKVDSTIEVMQPNGLFFAEVKKEQYKTYFLFAAGSGVTPILSILKTVLHTEPNSFVHMIYGNSDQKTIMFKDELDALETQFSERFILVHSLSNARSEWSDLWTSDKNKPYRTGRVDADAVKWFIQEYPPYAQNAEYYICGPGTMLETVNTTLSHLDVPANRLFAENFSGKKTDEGIVGIADAKLTAQLYGQQINTVIKEGKTVLRSLMDEGYNPPFSCEGGVCASCVCFLKKGKVHMKNNAALSEKEVAEGKILSCQSIPLSEELVVNYL